MSAKEENNFALAWFVACSLHCARERANMLYRQICTVYVTQLCSLEGNLWLLPAAMAWKR